jgi:hypothetical protein
LIRFENIDGLTCLVFICAQCRQPIQGSEAGLIQWDNYDNPTFTALHKGPDKPCTWQWDRDHGRDSWTGWRDLDQFLIQLSNSTRHPFEQTHDHHT